MSKRSRKLVVALLAVAALVLGACGSSDTAAKTKTTTVKASAAASLTEAFTRLGKDFTASHPDEKVTFNFDSSKTLSGQIVDGAPVDLFASADEANMTALTDKKLVDGAPKDFARNRLVIVTKPGNPKGVKRLADLAEAGVISLCGKDVPCGKFAAQALKRSGVTIDESKVTRGQNVKATLTAVSEGDAVAGIVYATDAQAAGSAVQAVTIPARQNAIATYPIGVLKGSSHADVAKAFMAYVLSDTGQATLERFGFLPPT